MKELFLTRDNLADKISYAHLVLLLASLPFDRFYSHIILISLIIHTLIHYRGGTVKHISIWNVLALVSVFLVTVYSTIYSTDQTGAYNEWGKQIAILLFPLLFCFNHLDLKKYRSSLLMAFSIVCTVTVIYLYSDVFFTIRYYKLPLVSLFSSSFINHNFSAPIDMHATFLSMQLGLALIYLLSVLFSEPRHRYRMLLMACIFILSAGLVQLCSKSVCFCLFTIISFGIPYFLLSGSGRWKFMLIATLLFCSTTFLVLKLHIFRERYVNELQFDLSESSAGESADPRLARWNAAIELIAKSPVIGYGAGAELPVLQNTYFEKKYYSSYLHRLNAHNQYLSFLLKSGVIGLLVYLATLGFGFKLAMVKHDFLFFAFLLSISFVSVSENLLDVNKGIMFYAFFFSFFLFSSGSSRRPDRQLIT